ncbi:MAG: transcriptional regulator [Gammaproteobacteria bacterium]|nr:transcriptional regulator [Gammaproteobacteria bacterium]
MQLAHAFRTARKALRHSRKAASTRTGVPEPTIRRFEDSGEISLRQFLILCGTYGNLDRAHDVLLTRSPSSINELANDAFSP